ncbi:STAS domain-containing protein [Streptomyces longisporoflavus]|uniref:STAS domain-containing protein n=1 Tax=Streptomyces longisporoflavus TaxID=28044 RepID=A0ABW7QQR4_9ACTN
MSPSSRDAFEEPLLVLAAEFHNPDAYVLTLRGTADATTSDQLEDAFTRAAGQDAPLIVDLGAMTFGDATLLGLLLNAYQDTRLILVGPLTATFQRRLSISGTEAIFTICPSLSRALASLA